MKGFKHKPWSPDNTEDGYIAYGRFIVYHPTHHRANEMGYTFRSIVHYEYFHNDVVTKEFAIHHIDGNKLNDTIENLQKLTNEEHTRLHRTLPKIVCICHYCGKIFLKDNWRLEEKGRSRGKYCCHEHYLESRSLPENRMKMKNHAKRYIRNEIGQVIGASYGVLK